MSAFFGLSYIHGLTQDVWEKSSPNERVESLQQLESVLAARQGRKDCEVIRMNLGEGTFGRYDPALPGHIQIHPDIVHLKDPKLAVDTISHEGRHAFQVDCFSRPDIHKEIDRGTIEAWEANVVETYTPPSGSDPVQHKAYLDQLVEVDARSYAKSVTDSIYPERSNEIHPALISKAERTSLYEFGQGKAMDATLGGQDTKVL